MDFEVKTEVFSDPDEENGQEQQESDINSKVKRKNKTFGLIKVKQEEEDEEFSPANDYSNYDKDGSDSDYDDKPKRKRKRATQKKKVDKEERSSPAKPKRQYKKRIRIWTQEQIERRRRSQRERRQNWSEEKKAEEREKARIRKALMTEEERKILKEREYAKKGKIYPGPRPPPPAAPEVAKERAAFQKMIRKMTTTEEEKERVRKLQRYRKNKEIAHMTTEEKAEHRRKQREDLARRKNLTPEEAQERYRESMRNGMSRYWAKKRKEDPEAYKKHLDKCGKRQTEMLAKEPLEKRQKRLLSYRINQAKKLLKKKLEKEGLLSKEEIQTMADALGEEMKSQPLPDPSTVKPYKPRVNREPLPPRQPRGRPRLDRLEDLEKLNVRKNREFKKKRRTPKSPPQVEEEQTTNIPPISVSPTSSTSTITPQPQHRFLDIVPSSTEAKSENEIVVPEIIPVQQPPPSSAPQPQKSFSSPPKLERVGLIKTKPTLKIEKAISISITISSGEGEGEDAAETPLPVLEEYDLESAFSASSCASLEEASPSFVPSPTASPPHSPLPQEEEGDNQIAEAETKLSFLPVSKPETAELKEMKIPPDSVTKSTPTIEQELCDDCGATFTSKFFLRVHKSEFHSTSNTPSNQNICPKCDFFTENKEALWSHFLHVHLNDNAAPDITIRKRRALNARSKHPRIQGEDKHRLAGGPCIICGKHFKQKATLDDHIRRVHQGKGIFCDLCSSELQSEAKLWRHKVDKHKMTDLPPPEGSELIKCKYCGENSLKILMHVKKKHPDRLKEFMESDEEKARVARLTKTKMNLRLENRLRAGNDFSSANFVPCKECGEMVDKLKMRIHMRQMHGFPCPSCKRIWGTEAELQTHYRSAHGFKNFEEKLAAKGLITFVNPLIKAAICTLCQESLNYSVEIKAHFVSAHHDLLKTEQLYSMPSVPCEVCSNKQSSSEATEAAAPAPVTFITEPQLRAHMESEHPEVSYVCPHCGLFRRRQADLDYHVKWIHVKGGRVKRVGICYRCKLDFRKEIPRDREWERDLKVREHVKAVHPESYFECPNVPCTKWVYSEASLVCHKVQCRQRQHLPLDIPVNEKRTTNSKYAKTLRSTKILCEVCARAITMDSMKEHLCKLHKIQRDFVECKYCPMKYAQMYTCVAHMEIFHEVPLQECVQLAPVVPDTGKVDSKEVDMARKKWKAGRVAARNFSPEKPQRKKRNRALIKKQTTNIKTEETGKRKPARTRPAKKKSGGGRKRMSNLKTVNSFSVSNPTSISTLSVSTTDIEKDKKLVIELYRLTEQELKPYIKLSFNTVL